MANYPADEADYRRSKRPPPMPSSNRYLPPLNREPGTEPRSEPPRGGSGSGERVTVTRAAAQRSRERTDLGRFADALAAFQRDEASARHHFVPLTAS